MSAAVVYVNLLICISITSMVLVLDGISQKGAHVRSNLCYLTCLRLLIKREPAQIGYFSPKRPFFDHACATCTELPSNVTMLGVFSLYIFGFISLLFVLFIYLSFRLLGAIYYSFCCLFMGTLVVTRIWCAHKEQSLVFELFKTFD